MLPAELANYGRASAAMGMSLRIITATARRTDAYALRRAKMLNLATGGLRRNYQK